MTSYTRDELEEEFHKTGWWNLASVYNRPQLPFEWKLTDSKTSRTDEEDSYGEYSQGSKEEVYLVLEVEGKFYRKTGTANSYGEILWDGIFREVEKKEKQEVTYEWVNA